MSAFVKPTDTFTVNFVIAHDAANPSVVLVEPTLDAMSQNWPNSANPEPHRVVFRFPRYEDDAAVVDKATEVKDGSLRFNQSMLRFYRLVTLTKEWTFKGEDGEITPITYTTIGDLHPRVGKFLGDAMEEVLGIL